MVHNLGLIEWSRMNDENYGFDWAVEANEKMKRYIINGDTKSLVDFRKQGNSFQLAIPTPEHYLPLLYAMALKDENDNISLFNDKAVAGSLTMTSVKIAKD